MGKPDQHIASAFDRDLEGIQALIMKMGGLVETAIHQAHDLSRKVICHRGALVRDAFPS